MDFVTPEEEADLEALRAAVREGTGDRESLKRLSNDHALRRQYWRRIGHYTGNRIPGPKVENNV